MSRAHSPLRYPGGKSCMLQMVSDILVENGLSRGHYAEPYAGGGSLALALLFKGMVSDIHLNDLDPGISAFWWAILNEPEAFIAKVEKCEITVPEWRKQRAIYQAADLGNRLDLGFATFFLNRTNRSGIIGSGGVIGGLDQTGNYKIDCRFNRSELVKRVTRINKYRSRIHLYAQDAVDFLASIPVLCPKRTFVAIDPPYFVKGSSLYTSFYNSDDHAGVAAAIKQLDRPWILTYDAVEPIRKLYQDRRQYLFDLKYSVQTKRTGTELLVVSKGLRVPESLREAQVHRPQYRSVAA